MIRVPPLTATLVLLGLLLALCCAGHGDSSREANPNSAPVVVAPSPTGPDLGLEPVGPVGDAFPTADRARL